jgi:hypothetical protein
MPHFDRRGFLKLGAILPWGYFGLGDLLRAQEIGGQSPGKKELSVIHLFLQGGLSQMDSFDPKPSADSRFRSPFKSISTNVPGLHVTEHLPLSAKQADKYTVIRSMNHKKAAHGEAVTMLLTGHDALPTLQPPSIGSVVNKELGPRNELPAYVWIPQSPGNSARGGFLGPTYNPFDAGEANVPKYSVRDLDLPMGVDWARMEGRHSLISFVDSRIAEWDASNTFESIDSYYRTALDLMRSPLAKKAFDISAEPEKLRDKYGRTTMGQGCLLARRLVEAGVRFVTVSKQGQAWDHHSNIFPLLANSFLPEFDAAYATLLEDLADRGMLDSTLVLVTGEFGRTPEINVNAGRDHWPGCFTVTVAGGGIEGGRVIGESDHNGMHIKDTPVKVPDFMASIYHKLGVDYTKENMSNIGRPLKIVPEGEPLSFL